MSPCLIISLLLIYQVASQNTTVSLETSITSTTPGATSGTTVPDIITSITTEQSSNNQIKPNTARINCTSSRIGEFLSIGSTFVPDILKCTDKMADLGHDYLVAMNEFYNYNYDDFSHDFRKLAQCDGLLCSNGDLSYVLSKLLRLRAQMNDMMEMVKYKSPSRKSTMRCVYKVMNRFTKAASKAIECPA